MSTSYWIWHPGAFELYHSMLLHNRRTSAKTVFENGVKTRRSVYYPPMWRADGPFRNAELSKTATIDKEETIELFSNTEDCAIRIDGKKHPKNTKITLTGRHDPAIIHRARAVVDAVTAIAMADMLIGRYGQDYLA